MYIYYLFKILARCCLPTPRFQDLRLKDNRLGHIIRLCHNHQQWLPKSPTNSEPQRQRTCALFNLNEAESLSIFPETYSSEQNYGILILIYPFLILRQKWAGKETMVIIPTAQNREFEKYTMTKSSNIHFPSFLIDKSKTTKVFN